MRTEQKIIVGVVLAVVAVIAAATALVLAIARSIRLGKVEQQ